MPLRVRRRRGPPPFVPVSLGGDAMIRVRCATTSDLEEATALAQRDLLGFMQSADSAGALSVIIGEEIDVSSLNDDAKFAAAAARLAEIHLVMTCQGGWSGIVDDDDEPVAEPDTTWIALLLQDARRRNAIMSVINAPLHEEVLEKNELSASPNGGAGIPDGAPSAGGSVTSVPAVAPSTGNIALN